MPLLLNHAPCVVDVGASEEFVVDDSGAVAVGEPVREVGHEVDALGDLGGGRGPVDGFGEFVVVEGLGRARARDLQVRERESLSLVWEVL